MFEEAIALTSFRCNCNGALSRAVEKPPAVERGVMKSHAKRKLMRSRTSASRWRIVLLAAARLAGLYAIGTALLLFPSFIALEGPPQALQDLMEFAAPIAFAFALAFVLLAVARRVGLVALWLTLGTLWGVAFRDIVGNPMDSAAAFVAWSELAIPLALLGGLGVPTTLRIGLGRWKPAVLTVTAALWIALLVPTLAMSILHTFWLDLWYHSVAFRIPNDFPRLIWAFGPPLISALSIAHVWVGTALAKVEAPAATRLRTWAVRL